MRVDLHVELHDVENSRPADSAPCFARLARNNFNWRDPLRKISKAVAPRDTKRLFGNPSDKRTLFRIILEGKLLKTGGSRETQNASSGLILGLSRRLVFR